MKPMTASPDIIAPAQRRRPTNGFVFWTGRVLLGLLALLVGLAALGASYQAVATAIDQRSYPAPGQLVDVGGEQMHINCVGEATAGAPTVILEHGLGGASPAWGWIQPKSREPHAYAPTIALGWAGTRQDLPSILGMANRSHKNSTPCCRQ